MSRDHSRSPRRERRYSGRDRRSLRDAPYRRDQGRPRQDSLCKNCKKPGHFARECTDVAVCNNCGSPGNCELFIGTEGVELKYLNAACTNSRTQSSGGQSLVTSEISKTVSARHLAAGCTSETMCWNCKEAGHLANQCSNDPICHVCNKTGHVARDCSELKDSRICNNCFKPGHIAVDCTNEKVCNNCREPGHVARDCPNDPVCNLCHVSGHVARQCPKTSIASQIVGGPFREIMCRSCGQPGHISRDCVDIIICNCCGGRGHMAFECPTASRTFERAYRRLM